MKHVGIVTLVNQFNYGNRLQNYASQKIYEGNSLNVTTLVLNRKANLSRHVKHAINKLRGKNESTTIESMMSAERLAAFSRFDRHIHFRIVDGYGLQQTGDLDYVSAGSDQIWSLRRWDTHGEDWSYLQFARRDQRIALAPSIGVDNLHPNQLRRLKSYVGGFDRLSIREDSGAALIKQASGRDAYVLCDPTLLLDAPTWASLADDRVTPKEPYVFAYLLGPNEESDMALRAATCDSEISIVCLSDRERSGEPPAGPAEFISLIASAKHVVTDSYHGSIFAMLFERPLTIVRRESSANKYTSMFGRLETLSRKFCLENKIYQPGAWDQGAFADYEGMEERICVERQRFMKYLEGCLHA